MKKLIMQLFLLAAVVALTSCGGGGGGSVNPGPTPPNGFTVTLIPVEASLPANTINYPIFLNSPFITQMSVKVEFRNGQPAPDGTVVNLTTSNTGVSFISVPDDPQTEEVNEFTTIWVTQFDETIGGVATFFIHSGSQEGTVRYTAGATTDGRTYSGTLNFNVTEGPDPTTEQLQAVLPRTTLPVNSQNIPFFNGTPFMIEADVQFKDALGNFTNPAANTEGKTVVSISINPVTVLTFSTLDDPTTNDNEFTARFGQGSVDMNSGHGNLFLWASNIPGTATVTMSAIDGLTGIEIVKSFDIEVVDGGSNPNIPSDVSIQTSTDSLYINGSGGSTSQQSIITVTSGGVVVNDPQVNNVRLSIVTEGANSGEKISGTNVNGSTVQGSSINVSTTNGIVSALVQSGLNANTITLTATVDGLDNNVDNGIQTPISASTTYIVSDGKLWALELVSPSLNALTVNGERDGNGQLLFQDGTYSLVISAIATDKGGNPALPQTLQFGMINSPITGFPSNGAGSFVHSSNNGDPQEGGSIFTSFGAGFLTSAGGVQPGDTLVVFGEESLGNEDLESAVTVSTINSQTTLTIAERFNRNDETGTIDNNFGVLPYAIGRAVDGNIVATAIIEDGVAVTELTYPTSQLGRIAAIYVKGQGELVNNVAKSVVDVEVIAFPGVDGFNGQFSTLTVSPNVIPGNVNNIGFNVCLEDSARNPLPGRYITFSYVGGNGQGIIDGQSGSGVMTTPTDLSGCASGSVSTSAVIAGGNVNNLGFNFFSGGLTCANSSVPCMRVVPPSNNVLNANPSSFIGRGSVPITLTLYDGSGNPITGASISGSCDQVNGGSLGITAGPSVTNSQGQSSVSVSVSLDGINMALNGTCTFETANGNTSVEVHFTGGDACALGGVIPSPVPPAGACPP